MKYYKLTSETTVNFLGVTLREKARELVEAKINNNAVGTWLEPYIGYTVKVIKTTKNTVWFKWDMGELSTEHHDKINFDFK